MTSETVWNNGTGKGATGGGYSTAFDRPAWQAAALGRCIGGGAAVTGRGVPDVAGRRRPADRLPGPDRRQRRRHRRNVRGRPAVGRAGRPAGPGQRCEARPHPAQAVRRSDRRARSRRAFATSPTATTAPTPPARVGTRAPASASRSVPAGRRRRHRDLRTLASRVVSRPPGQAPGPDRIRELVALGIGEHEPAPAVGSPTVGHLRRPKGEDAIGLVLATAVGRPQIEMDPVLELLGVGHLDRTTGGWRGPGRRSCTPRARPRSGPRDPPRSRAPRPRTATAGKRREHRTRCARCGRP